MPLSPVTSDAMNVKLPTTPPDCEISWEDPPSSPFLDEVPDQENLAPEPSPSQNTDTFNTVNDFRSSKRKSVGTPSRTPTKSPRTSITNETPRDVSGPASRRASRQDDNLIEATPRRSVTPASAVKATPPRQLMQDDDLMEETPRPTTQASAIKATPSRRYSTQDDDLLGETPRPVRTPASAIKATPSRSRHSRTKSSPVKHALPSLSDDEKGLRENEGLTVAIKGMEDMKPPPSARKTSHDYEMEADDIDDTCFSAFSEIPNTDMTAFARMGRTPTKPNMFDPIGSTPRPRNLMTPATARRQAATEGSPTPTPKPSKSTRREKDETTNLLLDFTEQFESISAASLRRQSPSKGSPTKSIGDPGLLSYINNQRSPKKTPRPSGTPNKNLLNLLDFELPPPSTPRSIPTITVRELESLKSSYLSQISQLTASLSGKDATIDSLTKAVGDAERRVGQSQETVREERAAREHAEKEKSDWEKRGSEVEEVLRSIKKEIVESEKEREELCSKLEASERRADEADARAADAQAKVLETEGRLVDQTTMITTCDSDGSGPRYTAEEVQKQIDEKVETLCRELHLVYKKKHETKVSALKKSYEAKSEKKLSELSRKVEALMKQNEDLQSGKESTFSSVLPSDLSSPDQTANLKRLEEQKDELDLYKAELEMLKAKLAGLSEEVRVGRIEHTTLLEELEQERVEKGELVAAAEQMLTLQQDFAASQPEVVEDFRKSASAGALRPAAQTHASMQGKMEGIGGAGPGPAAGMRSSGLKQPGESRIGRGMGMSGMQSGLAKSRMMSNIERMGGAGRSYSTDH